ncbi:hypothetical protein SERLA73DRAFT_136633 [Serpula lacrymans var. lacrymans S7.3]|uniref:Myb-like domain-containing protein n=2 Tax=Serpula lacrymans var. lacrymans TaxID=341189 RepID=F8PXV8_SERL3|nr:uncharacterized protein SERLADRAFT_389336 [Serpula lacrymans var. lacrymans S7.9]EGN98721.1 hypothetical protein SERLA73DRAFT_136633 [Serpula lacrymans var. lacrymans S7.3]EGO24322.1 hypothetical protein SERLADRAFT_389336 [Serpula lacrymans var. lacrymans S7.9]
MSSTSFLDPQAPRSDTVSDGEETTIISTSTGSKDHYVWSEKDISALIQFLKANLAAAADGGMFKKSFWAPLLKQFVETHTAGASKGWEACNSKWQRLSTRMSKHNRNNLASTGIMSMVQ